MQSRRGPLIAIAFLCVGVVLGFLFGGVGPRSEVEDQRAEIAELERRLESADTGGWRSPVPGLDRILRAPDIVERPLPPVEPGATGEVSPSDPIPEAVGDGGAPEARPRWRERWGETSGPGDRLAAFQRAASLQRVRRVQSRAALEQQADLTPEEMAELDQALLDMNEELYGHGEELIVLAIGDEPPDARDLLGITHDVTGILHRAQLRLEGVVGADRLSDVEPSAVEIWNHIDLAQLEPAARAAMRNPR